jgi:gamma-glutamyl hercynylcysteine S-oxide synthase
MRSPLKLSLDQVLVAAVPLSLAAAWLSGYWMVGGIVAVAALCGLAIRSPRLPGLQRLGWLRGFASSSDEAERWVAADTAPSALAAAPRRTPLGTIDTPLVKQMLDQGRVALLLRPQIASSLSARDLEAAQIVLDDMMAIVPQGPVAMRARCYDLLDEEVAPLAQRLVKVEGFFLDRYAVSNRDYQQFVDDGGYEQMSLWEESIWPAVLSFVDATGQPGPRFWQHGNCPAGKEDHPVVGVCWYEACAFARWAGKRLPTDAEWVKAGSWPVFAENGKPVQRRFPFGDAMDRRKVNIWGSGHSGTVPVYGLPESASVNGVQQLVGNVWEWTSSAFGAWEPSSLKIETSMPLKSVRGGAFDSYFDTQANCQFQSGENPLARRHNIGFRCALGFCDVHLPDEPPEPEAENAPVPAKVVDDVHNEEVLA